MSGEERQAAAIERLAAADRRFQVDAYYLILDSFTQARERVGAPNISPGELLCAVAVTWASRYGPVALTVLEELGLSRSADVVAVIDGLVRERLLVYAEGESAESVGVALATMDFGSVVGIAARHSVECELTRIR